MWELIQQGSSMAIQLLDLPEEEARQSCNWVFGRQIDYARPTPGALVLRELVKLFISQSDGARPLSLVI